MLKDVHGAIRKILGPHYSLRFDTELKAFNEKEGYWVPLRLRRPVGVVEILAFGDRGMDHPDILGRCFDRMMKIRSFEGLDHVYCILTSYHQWRFLCLEDTAEDARSTVMPEVNEPAVRVDPVSHLPPDLPAWVFGGAGGGQHKIHPFFRAAAFNVRSLSGRLLPASPAIQTAAVPRRVCASRVFQADDIKLVEAIAAIFVKMATSPATRIAGLVDDSRPCRIMGPLSWQWGSIPRDFQLSARQ